MRHNFLHLDIWKKSRILVKEIYQLTHKFPSDEKFGLTSQMRRASVSIPSNIAEGCGRGTDPQLSHFLDIAIGSLCELETQIYLSYDLNFLSKNNATILVKNIIEIRRMTKSFRDRLNSKHKI